MSDPEDPNKLLVTGCGAGKRPALRGGESFQREPANARPTLDLEDKLGLKAKSDLEAKVTELLSDEEFRTTLDFVASEAGANWRLSRAMARAVALSALGEPKDLVAVHAAWFTGQTALARTILRRRMLDLFRKDARRASHISFPVTTAGAEAVLGLRDKDLQRNPAEWLDYVQGLHGVRAAVACLAQRGVRQRQQARLLQRYFLEEIPYSRLSTELACTEGALRVRVHKAIKALRNHIVECHSELLVISSAYLG